MVAEARNAARVVLAMIDEAAPFLRSSSEESAQQFGAAGLMRCCALLRSILALDEAHAAGIARILEREHRETWLVAMYVLLSGDSALGAVVGDGVSSSAKCDALGDRVSALLSDREDGVARARANEFIHDDAQCSVGLQATIAKIARHIERGPGEWRVTPKPSSAASDVIGMPLMRTVFLAQHVFAEFGIDRGALDRIMDHATYITDTKVRA